jgi:hypothetical protein
MTRFIHDQFAKDYLEELLKPYGKVEAQKPVSAEVRYIDIFFRFSEGDILYGRSGQNCDSSYSSVTRYSGNFVAESTGKGNSPKTGD